MGKRIIVNLLNATIIYPLLSAIFKQNFIQDWSLTQEEVMGNYKLVVIEIIYLIVVFILSKNLKVSKKLSATYFFKQWVMLFVYAIIYSLVYYPINKGSSNYEQVVTIAILVASIILLVLSFYNYKSYKKRTKNN